MTKVKHLIDADMIGSPNVYTQLVLTPDPKTNYVTLMFRDRKYLLSGDELNTLLVIETRKATKDGTALIYSFKLLGTSDDFLSQMFTSTDQIIQANIEIPDVHVALALHSLGHEPLTKEELKCTILKMYEDNFEALKALRKHGVIKNVEKDIKQTLSQAQHKI